MDPQILFLIIIAVLTLDFIIDKWIDHLNALHFDDEVPEPLKDVYVEEEYQKSQAYKKENYRFSLISSTFSFLVTMAFFLFKGFAWVDGIARGVGSSNVTVALVFFGIIMLGSDILNTPFSFYRTFVIEEKYGFNKSTKRLFFIDKIKGWMLSIIIGGAVLAVILWFFEKTGPRFWVYTWVFIGVFTVFMTLFYSTWIVPLFNKQTPLEEGPLKTAINRFADKVGFSLKNIYVIDGSKRSTKANAYFSGFGGKKRIVLYDTLFDDLDQEEIVAWLVHEIGNYKKKHVIFNLISSLVITGITLYIFSLFIENSVLSEALSVSTPSFHIGLITFGILYSPISEVTGILMNYISRRFEYQADNYARDTYKAEPLISSLKKLSRNSLSNLTPHKVNVFVHYSHPTLYQRILNLQSVTN